MLRTYSRLLKNARSERYRVRQRMIQERTVRSRYGARARELVRWNPLKGKHQRVVVWSPRPSLSIPVNDHPKPFYPSWLFPRYPYVPRLNRSGNRLSGFRVVRDRLDWVDAVEFARERYYSAFELDL